MWYSFCCPCSRVSIGHAVADQPVFVRRELESEKTRRHTHPDVSGHISQRNEMHVLVSGTGQSEGAVGIPRFRPILRRTAVSVFFFYLYSLAVNVRWKVFINADYYFYSCPFDVVSIYDGLNSSSPLIGQYCGQQRNLVVYSTESYLYVTFDTLQRAANTQNRGFKGMFEFSESFVKLGTRFTSTTLRPRAHTPAAEPGFFSSEGGEGKSCL